jgi:hypothetical protein
MLAYSDPSLGLKRASAKTNVNNDNWFNAYLGQVVPFGDGLLVGSMMTYDCVYIVDATTLYAPASWPDPYGCFTNAGGSSNIEGLYHLTAP